MQLVRSVVGAGLAFALAAATIVGCSSSHRPTAAAVSTTTSKVSPITAVASTRPPTTTLGSTAKEAAIALAQRMLTEALVPAGARPSTAKAPSVLRGPFERPMGKNVEFAHRLWTVSDEPLAVYKWLRAHVPRGYVNDGTVIPTKDGVPLWWGVHEGLLTSQENISDAELEFGVAKNAGGGTTVRADSVVGWTEPRLANEYVSGADRTVIVTELHSGEPGSPRGRRVATSDAKLVGPVVRAFNRLAVDPASAYSCPAEDSRTVSYEVVFANASTATPDVAATIGNCGGIAVTVRGHRAPSLRDSPDFEHAVARLLGLPELAFR